MKTNHSRAYFPTYEYVINDEIIRVEMNWGTTYCQYKKGDQVKIWYDYHDPVILMVINKIALLL